MKYVSTLIAVRDIGVSKRFYYEVLGLEVTADYGANAVLGDRIALQTDETWAAFLGIGPERIIRNNLSCELYFEEEDFDGFLKMLGRLDGIRYVHPVVEHSFGQRAMRFFDPDGHVIEVGEPIAKVARRFSRDGLSVADIAKRMDVPVGCVSGWLG